MKADIPQPIKLYLYQTVQPYERRRNSKYLYWQPYSSINVDANTELNKPLEDSQYCKRCAHVIESSKDRYIDGGVVDGFVCLPEHKVSVYLILNTFGEKQRYRGPFPVRYLLLYIYEDWTALVLSTGGSTGATPRLERINLSLLCYFRRGNIDLEGLTVGLDSEGRTISQYLRQLDTKLETPIRTSKINQFWGKINQLLEDQQNCEVFGLEQERVMPFYTWKFLTDEMGRKLSIVADHVEECDIFKKATLIDARDMGGLSSPLNILGIDQLQNSEGNSLYAALKNWVELEPSEARYLPRMSYFIICNMRSKKQREKWKSLMCECLETNQEFIATVTYTELKQLEKISNTLVKDLQDVLMYYLGHKITYSIRLLFIKTEEAKADEIEVLNNLWNEYEPFMVEVNRGTTDKFALVYRSVFTLNNKWERVSQNLTMSHRGLTAATLNDIFYQYGNSAARETFKCLLGIL